MTENTGQIISLPDKQPPGYELIKASEIEPKEVSWLWYPFIPYGKVTLLQGDPGDGKSTFMLNIAALLTRGENLPFAEPESPPEPMNIIYQTTEDDAEDTVVPRFMKANGDRDRLLFINEKDKPIFFDDDRIEAAIRGTGAKMLILDPLSSYIGDCQINAANEVRPRFNHLIRVAKETGCAIVIINHLNKMFGIKAIYRTPGSIDIVGAVRSALLVGRDKEEENVRILVQQKANLAPTGAAIKFSIGEEGVTFLEETELTADDLLAGYSQSGGRPDVKTQEAIRIIRELLMEQNDQEAVLIEAKLRESGISKSTAKRAKRMLGVESLKPHFSWLWHLPEGCEA
jgi:DNA repair protein RadA/Sms